MGRKTFIQVLAAILSGLNVAVPLLLDAQDVSEQWPWQYHALVGFVAYIMVTAWAIWDRQMQINKSRERIRLAARPGSLAINTEKPLGRDEISIYTAINFEIWADTDIHTAKLVLNVVGVRQKRWWLPWTLFLPATRRRLGISPEGLYEGIYRKQINHTNAQPFQDHATFHWKGKWDVENWGSAFILELALEMGSPQGVWRAIVDPKLYERGASSPL